MTSDIPPVVILTVALEALITDDGRWSCNKYALNGQLAEEIDSEATRAAIRHAVAHHLGELTPRQKTIAQLLGLIK